MITDRAVTIGYKGLPHSTALDAAQGTEGAVSVRYDRVAHMGTYGPCRLVLANPMPAPDGVEARFEYDGVVYQSVLERPMRPLNGVERRNIQSYIDRHRAALERSGRLAGWIEKLDTERRPEMPLRIIEPV